MQKASSFASLLADGESGRLWPDGARSSIGVSHLPSLFPTQVLQVSPAPSLDEVTSVASMSSPNFSNAPSPFSAANPKDSFGPLDGASDVPASVEDLQWHFQLDLSDGHTASVGLDDGEVFIDEDGDSKGSDVRGVPWTKMEHGLFLLGLQHFGKGNWRNISQYYVKSRTSAQVAVYAQRFFARQHSPRRQLTAPRPLLDVSRVDELGEATKHALRREVESLQRRMLPESMRWVAERDFERACNGDDGRPRASRRGEECPRRGLGWSEVEHCLFLLGLEEFGRGRWRDIAKNYVPTRTGSQVASHAQKFFLRQRKERRDLRRSILDITLDELLSKGIQGDLRAVLQAGLGSNPDSDVAAKLRFEDMAPLARKRKRGEHGDSTGRESAGPFKRRRDLSHPGDPLDLDDAASTGSVQFTFLDATTGAVLADPHAMSVTPSHLSSRRPGADAGAFDMHRSHSMPSFSRALDAATATPPPISLQSDLRPALGPPRVKHEGSGLHSIGMRRRGQVVCHSSTVPERPRKSGISDASKVGMATVCGVPPAAPPKRKNITHFLAETGVKYQPGEEGVPLLGGLYDATAMLDAPADLAGDLLAHPPLTTDHHNTPSSTALAAAASPALPLHSMPVVHLGTPAWT